MNIPVNDNDTAIISTWFNEAIRFIGKFLNFLIERERERETDRERERERETSYLTFTYHIEAVTNELFIVTVFMKSLIFLAM